jgi:decaprenylphospho-beta-D-erythro-pentofuranosid-2-ulose 2-reductase
VNVAILGGTKGIGRALARLLAERGDRIFLLGRDLADLERSAHDLDIRSGKMVAAGVAYCDLASPETFAPALDAAEAALGTLDTVIVTAADFASQAVLESDPDRCRQLLTVNFTGTVLLCEDARRRLLPRGGTLCVLS